MPNHKHLSLDDRSFIQFKLNECQSFRQIARGLDKSPAAISKEVRHHRISLVNNAVGRIPNKCTQGRLHVKRALWIKGSPA